MVRPTRTRALLLVGEGVRPTSARPLLPLREGFLLREGVRW